MRWSCTILMFLRSLSVKAYEVLKLLMANGELAQFIPFAFVGPPCSLSPPFGGDFGAAGRGPPALFSFRTFVKLMLLRIWYSWPANLRLSRSSWVSTAAKDSLKLISGSSGLNCGFLKLSLKLKNIGNLMPASWGKNLSRFTLVWTPYERSANLFRSLTVWSIDPKPMVLIVPVRFTLATSASLALAVAVAAHPPRLSKSLKRNSLTQISAHLAKPSSPSLAVRFFGFRTPTSKVRMLPKFGAPTTESLWPSGVVTVYLLTRLKVGSLSIAAFRVSFSVFKSSNTTSILLSFGQMSSGNNAPHGVTLSGTSYS